MAVDPDFELFFIETEPRLRRAFIGTVGIDRAGDAVAEALAYGWEHWDKIAVMVNPVGYLYRVGQSRTRPRRRPQSLVPAVSEIPEIEPGLPAALAVLPAQQQAAVWLAHGCGWSHAEIADALDVTASSVSTHVNRGLARLRNELGVRNDA